MITTLTDSAIARGTSGSRRRIRLADRQEIIVAAGPETSCTPTPAPQRINRGNREEFFDVPAGYPGPYTALRVGIDFGPEWLDGPRHAPSDWPTPEPGGTADVPYYLREIRNEDEDVRWYSYVPASTLRSYVLDHGGEHAQQDTYDKFLWPFPGE